MTLRTQKRRRREAKTDYKLRIGLLKSGLKRIAIRKTNTHIILQLIESKEAQDSVIYGLTSKVLLKKGFGEGQLKSISAAYLTGKIFGEEIIRKKIGGEFILDLGMAIHHPGGRIYSAAKGLVDAGLKIRIDEKVFPKENKIKIKNMEKK